ncbi:MAG: LPS assembly protein LptD [Limimaricola sp.]|uniref:LPS-assembly protein LptD n=1 Tax=Limimaricola sp. TaxID=2211665 RepID=UPI001E176B2D|nr:LPS assembly protein LptD [Limimaricola sp.]MBI1418290.1 LPS assembly protein LptD [Limimaricola sp.]
MRRFAALLALCAALLPGLAAAQTQTGAATMVADSVRIEGGQRLIATGNVEVLYMGTRLSAGAIRYDAATDRLLIEGPIYVAQPDGTVLTANSATLDPQLQNGILDGARLILQQQLQLAANRIERSEGRYSDLYRVVATACEVCNGGPPLWEIRARHVTHDQAEQQLYFEDAQFRIAGIPVLWVPRMRLPDPTLKRATGLLVPSVRSNDTFGTGIKLPYFITLGDSRDLTLTPYLAPRTTTLEARYRQAFTNGTLEAKGAISRDQILSDRWRGYLFANGAFKLRDSWQLSFDVQSATDKAYLLDYGYANLDRLQSNLGLTRVTDHSFFTAEALYFQTQSDTEVNASLPPVVTSLHYQRRLTPGAIGGTLTLDAGAEAFVRTSTTPGDAGRDVARLGLGADWRRSWMLPAGVLVELHGGLDAAAYRTAQDPAYDGLTGRLTPSLGATLRWPLMRQQSGGAVQILEPVLALGWSRLIGGDVANEDSTRVEFDEGNLFDLNHFPGDDRVETGARAIAGLAWSTQAPGGWGARLTFGRVFRQDANADLSSSSGLSGTRSDWLVAGQFDLPRGFALDGRALFDDGFTPGKSEARINWQNSRVDLTGSYVWLPTDPAEARSAPVSEWTFNGDYKINDIWSVNVNGQYDIAARSPTSAGFGIGWQNECVTVELSVSRRYTSSTTVQPATDVGLTVGLNGFSAGRSGQTVRSRCTN